MLLAIVMGIALAGSLIEYRSLARLKQRRDIAVGAVFLAAGLLLGVLRLAQVNLPSPLGIIDTPFQPASQFVAKLLS